MKINTLPELLAPAGDFESLVCAVNAGADAVYVGGKQFSARAFAKNFDIDELRRAAGYCHIHNAKLYVTVNTLLFDKELEAVSDYAAALWEAGVDAVIAADPGVIATIHRRVPELEIHASTQLSVHNTLGAALAAELGATRVVLARELSYSDIKKTTEEAPITTEVFLHGALCVCTSGQCLMSSLVGGRSGNRGECAQPCRLPYNGGKYVLSLKDLSLSNHIKELCDAGVASLKIEGRMKSPDYVYTVTSIYRRLLDEYRNASAAEAERLSRVFSRGGFTDGYFTGETFGKMTGVRSEEDKEKSRNFAEVDPACYQLKKLPIKAKMTIKVGKNAELTLISDKKTVTAIGPIPREAISAPLDAEAICQRLCKMGNTSLSLTPSQVEIELDEGLNLSPGEINALRRDAAAMLEGNLRTSCAPVSPEAAASFMPKRLRSALFLNEKSFADAYRMDKESFGYFDAIFLPLFAPRHSGANGVYIPPTVFDSQLPEVREALASAVAQGAKYALLGNISHLTLAKEAGLIPIGDFRLNVTNAPARDFYASLGVEYLIASCEMNSFAVRDLSVGAVVYGRIPLMLTERCFIKENYGCEKCSTTALVDRTGAKFPIIREYPHRNLILNSVPTFMGDKPRELEGIMHRHFIFSTEGAKDILAVISAYKKGGMPQGLGAFRRMGKR